MFLRKLTGGNRGQGWPSQVVASGRASDLPVVLLTVPQAGEWSASLGNTPLYLPAPASKAVGSKLFKCSSYSDFEVFGTCNQMRISCQSWWSSEEALECGVLQGGLWAGSCGLPRGPSVLSVEVLSTCQFSVHRCAAGLKGTSWFTPSCSGASIM